MSKLPPTSTHPPLGTVIHDNTIQLVEVLGSGGYGVVFRGIDLSSKRHRKYAVKCMSKAKNRRPTHVRELNYHLQVTGHPGVVEIYGAVEDDKYTYFVMEYATSNDLFHQILHESRYLGQDAVIRDVFLQLLDGVQHCHNNGVFHRDLKPENVMCFEDGFRVAITDFGLATSDTSSCEFRTGSVYHMSPECQAGHYREDAYSPRANDVWSLGIILLNMVTGRNPWKAATKDDPVYQSYLKSPHNFFASVLPISLPFNNLLVQVLNPDWDSRASLSEFRDLVERIPTFYSVNVHFDGNLARYCWEAGIKARTDLVDGINGPVAKRPVPPPPLPNSRKPVSPIHEETRARPVETAQPRKRTVARHHHHHHHRPPPPPAPKARIIHRRIPTPHHASHANQLPSPQASMESVLIDGRKDRTASPRISTIEVTHTTSSRGNSSPSSSFPKTPGSSPHRVTIVKRRPRLASDLPLSPSYSPQLDDPMEFYGLEFCKRLAALPSDADSDATDDDDSMVSPSSSQYSLQERDRLSWTSNSSTEPILGSKSLESEGDGSDIVYYPEIQTPEPSKPIDIAGARTTRRDSSSVVHSQRRHHQQHHHRHHTMYQPHLASVHLSGNFRQRRPMPPEVPPRPGGRVAELRKRYEGSPAPSPGHATANPYERQAAYASGNAHWYH